MKNYIVTTTIQAPTEATIKFSSMPNWKLIVVGDKKTPHHLYEKINCLYLHPDEQEKLYPNLSNCLGWNTIQRRNIGFVHAYNLGAEIMATVDDDNIPYDYWGSDVLVNKEVEIDLWKSNNGYFDPLSVTKDNHLWHRGYPLEMVKSKNDIVYLGKKKRKVLVQADLWDGDPDVDAMCRLPHKPLIKYEISSPYGSQDISPFNSQNTFVAREIIPYYMMLPFVGRMDDIWGCYNLYNIFSNFVVYNKSTVYQERNKQDLVTNLEKEIIGYRNTLKLLTGEKSLFEISDQSHNAYIIYRECFK